MNLTNSTIKTGKRLKRNVYLDLEGDIPHWEFCKVVTALNHEDKYSYTHFAYAERMVAAWNAFKGIPTEQISPSLICKQRGNNDV